MKVLIIALCISAGLNLIGLGVFIRGFWFAKGAVRPPVHPRFEQRLHLSPKQRETMQALRGQMAAEMDSIRTELDGKRKEILKLLKEPEVDTVTRNRLFSAIANMQMRLELKMFDHAIAVRNILTPEQRSLFFQPMEERFREWSGPFGPGPGPDDENRPRMRMHHQPDLRGGNE